MDCGERIADNFKGKVVFITGASGFVGKVLLEKLLRSCPGISEVVLLFRPGKDGCEERFAKFKTNDVFDALRTKSPNALDKVRCVSGDVVSDNMGLDESSLKKVINEVSIVFHCAASVRFEEDPKTTFGINLIGVKNVLDVCLSMKKLEAFVHVSTAYSFCNQNIVTEEIYEESTGPQKILECLKWMDNEKLKVFCDFIVKGRPSLYHYSKAMAEIYLAENCGKVPVIIVRPSIITASANEPFPGWIDNHNGPSGFIALSSKGIIRTLLVKKDVTADFVPVDTVANTIIAAAHIIITERQTGVSVLTPSQPSGIPVINCVCPESKRISWSNVVKICVPLLSKYPSLVIYRLPGKGIVTSSCALHTICKYFYHYLPSVILDIILYPYYRKMRLVRTFRRIHGVMDHLQHYTTYSYDFTSNNMKKLAQELSANDLRTFPIDLSNLTWLEYLETYVYGVRRFYLKEKDSSLDKARTKVKRLQYLHYGTNAAIYLFILKQLYKLFPEVKSGVDWSLKLILKPLIMIGRGY